MTSTETIATETLIADVERMDLLAIREEIEEWGYAESTDGERRYVPAEGRVEALAIIDAELARQSA